MHPPAAVLEPIEASVDRSALVELATVFAEEIRLHADGAVLFGNLLRGFVAMRCDNDHRVEMRMIEAERYIEQIIEADAGGHGFEAQGLAGVERKITLRIGGHGGEKVRLVLRVNPFAVSAQDRFHAAWRETRDGLTVLICFGRQRPMGTCRIQS